MRNCHVDIKVIEQGGGEGAIGAAAEIPLQPVNKIMVKQRKSVRRKEQQRGTFMDRPQPTFPIMLHSLKGGEVEESGMEE